ncbi:MAG TPA: universal stress protein [Gemmatimonadales bacterium]
MPTQDILVALDGSAVAEGALTEAAELAKALHASVTFLRVIPPVDAVIEVGAMMIPIDEIWAAERDQALRYLNEIAQRPGWRGVSTTAVVEMGSPAETILDIARKLGVRRIVMTTHGRTGLRRWLLGSVAEKVLRAADRTVVLVRGAAAEGGS